MWQGQQYYQQSDVMDCTFQCPLNVDKMHLRKFSEVCAHPAQQTASHDRTNNDMLTTGDQAQISGSITQYPVNDVFPSKFNYQCEFDPNHPLQNYLPNTVLGKTERSYFEMGNGISQVIQHKNRYNINMTSNDEHNNFSDFSGFNFASLNDSGNGSTYMNLQQINSSANDYNKSCIGQPTFSQMLGNSEQCHVPYEYINSCHRQTCSCVPANATNQQYTGNIFDNTIISGENDVNGTPSMQSLDHESYDELSKETKIALRESDVMRRIFAFRTINTDAANDIENYYQSQTTVIDCERQNIMRQMQYDEAGMDYICMYFNRKLLSLLESVEQKLSILEANGSRGRKIHKEASERSRLLPKQAVKLMETWYQENLANPYPSREATVKMASVGTITVEQIRKWFANKRNRSRNN